jgi:hypothetical protein
LDEYLKFLFRIKMAPSTFKSNLARDFASFVAEASSRSHITCLNGAGINSGMWLITAQGHQLLKRHGRIK